MKPILLLFLFLMLTHCKSPEARPPETVQSGSFIKASAERNIKLNEREHALIKTIMDQNPNIDYMASESGFWYYYNTKVECDTITPRFGDLINFSYDVRDLNDRLIYAAEDLNVQEYVMDKQEIFTGLREGLKLMKPGETITFLFPSQKAYGYYGDANKIGTNVPLICQVTVNTIIQNQ